MRAPATCLLRSTLFVLANIAALGSGGCIPAVHPILTDATQATPLPNAMMGTWKLTDEDGRVTIWHLTPPPPSPPVLPYAGRRWWDWYAYRLIVREDESVSHDFLVHATTIGDALFLDLCPCNAGGAGKGFNGLHYLPVHTFWRVKGEPPSLDLLAVNYFWLEELLDLEPEAVAHAIWPRSLVRTGGIDTLVLTAPTDELRAFLEKHLDDEKAFYPFYKVRILDDVDPTVNSLWKKSNLHTRTDRDICEGVRYNNPDFVEEAKLRKLTEDICGPLLQ